MASRNLCADHAGLAEHGRWVAGPRFLPKRLSVPLRRRKPTGFAVALMGDLFHDHVADAKIDDMFGVMAATPHHRYYLLTKRAARMAAWFAAQREDRPGFRVMHYPSGACGAQWPLRNVWLGVSVENQATADERIPHLLRCPAAVRWVSAEPLLGPMDLRHVGHTPCADCRDALARMAHGKAGARLDWVVAGGESGPKARPFDLAWARSVRDQCRSAGVPYFLKQLGSAWARANGRPGYAMPGAGPADRAGADPSEFPEDLRVRQWPEAP